MDNIEQIRVLLVEDDDELRNCLVTAINRSPAMKCVGAFSNAEEALDNIVRLVPEVIVLDLVLPGMDGVACTAALKQLLPDSEVLVLTAVDTPQLVLSVIKAGARGYLMKQSSPEHLLQGIQDVWDGGSPMNPVIARMVLESFNSSTPSGVLPSESLTPREEEILQLLVRGTMIKSIPSTLNISINTVRFHLRQIYKKLHVTNMTQAVVRYLEK